MNISSIDSYGLDIPDYADISIQPSSPSFETPDPVDQVAPPREIGDASVVNIDAVAQDNIQTQALQQDFLFNLDELRNGNISREDFSNFLGDSGLNNLNLQEQVLNTQNDITTDANYAAALFSITNETANSTGENKLSSFANMMDKINEQTQSPDVREKLQAYTSNL
ncbi:hypothetical protein [Arcobacter roscoffensis]|uniref:EF-hand domain-containing protein n=1 Tax=Arcobacter roscoffensis TaxID=2961520 RepID=A0ABY5E6K3_9BACT|nr:hypothetical protein [Arcobacter roscoffensis]UTJ07380.1 hypothetical protein NJU99_04620 [Arcobacter roscoffensis]